jgi:hypothetical protein
MNRFLYIFIDGFPYSHLYLAEFLNTFFSKKVPFTPGLGYSVNIHAEIFFGKLPDNIGHFNIYDLDSNFNAKFPLIDSGMLYNSSGLIRIEILDNIIHKIFGKLHITKSNIPFPYQHYFSRKKLMTIKNGKDFFKKSVFSEKINMEFCISEEIQLKSGNRDRLNYEYANKLLENKGNLLVTFVDLDSISHRFGVGTERHTNHIKQLDYWIQKLVMKFLSLGGSPDKILIFSDHGMVNVRQRLKCQPENYLGKPGLDSYIYFTDSTMIRVWIKNYFYKPVIEKYFDNLKFGRVLTQFERSKYGVTSRRFGDYIYLLDEGIVFSPCFINRGKVPAAMHGYHPDLYSQKGIFLSNLNHLDIFREFRSVDLFCILQNK